MKAFYLINSKIKNCLFSQTETDLLKAQRENLDIKPLIISAILAKKKQRGGAEEFDEDFVENMKNRAMIAIGG